MYRIEDSREWRIKANNYVLEVSEKNKDIYPFYFVWNDYIIPDNLSDYAGIKWHRHWDEPRYNYDDPRCREILKLIEDLSMPVLIEEEYNDTVSFIRDNSELNIIIPHIGNLNGGYDKMDVTIGLPAAKLSSSAFGRLSMQREGMTVARHRRSTASISSP